MENKETKQNKTSNIREYNKEWYKKNRDHRRAYFKECIICECGTTVTRGSKNLHMKSKKHSKLLTKIKNNIE